jgi:hypothetical protein
MISIETRLWSPYTQNHQNPADKLPYTKKIMLNAIHNWKNAGFVWRWTNIMGNENPSNHIDFLLGSN